MNSSEINSRYSLLLVSKLKWIEMSYHNLFSLSFKIRSGNAAMRHIKPNLLQSRQFSECFHKSIFIFQIRLINHIIPVSISIIKKHWFTVTYTSMALNQSTQRKGAEGVSFCSSTHHPAIVKCEPKMWCLFHHWVQFFLPTSSWSKNSLKWPVEKAASSEQTGNSRL